MERRSGWCPTAGWRSTPSLSPRFSGNTACSSTCTCGSLGIALVRMAPITGLDLQQLSAMVGRQLPLFSFIVPFWLVAAQVGFRRMWQVWPACFVGGATFSVMQFVMSNYHGPWLVDIVSAAVAMVSLLVLMQFWKPKEELVNEAPPAPAVVAAAPVATGPAWKAWLPWIF